MTDPNDSKDLPIRLEVLPGTRRRSSHHEFEPKAARFPWLMGEGALLVLGVEGADGGELDPAVAVQHRYITSKF